jgi:hypothetical protein
VQGYGIICRPLFDTLKKDAFVWTEIQDQAFQKLKTIMSTPQVLTLPNFSKPFIWSSINAKWQANLLLE